jgi:hypothetical protein
MTRTRRSLTILLSVFSLLLVASAGFAASRQDAPEPRGAAVTTPAPGDGDEEGDDRGTEDEGGAEDEASTDEGAVDPEREAACNEASGVEPVEEGTDEGATGDDGTGDETTEEESEPVTGLDNAISHVLENCLKNPQAPGLVNALEHLVANQARHDALEAAKAERAAERAARKAAHEHGPSGDHGNPHTDGERHAGGNDKGHGHA